MRQDSSKDLKARTKCFALSVIGTIRGVRRSPESDILRRQIIRSATSIGANYRSACRARSRADFISKIKISLEEADETQYWLELLFELHLIEEKASKELHEEADELIAIFVSSAKTAGSMKDDK
jgi:four helix bundle protein